MALPDLHHVRPALWDLSQKIFGADSEKERLYFETLSVKSPASPILDFGCATGNAATPFVGLNYTGIDIDPVLIEYARFKFRAHPELKFIAQDINSFEPAQPFDYILFAGVAHHIDDDALPTILARLRSMLSADGFIYFIDPIVTGTEGPLLRFLMDMDQGKFHRSAQAYERLFAQHNFHVSDAKEVDIKGALFPTPRGVVFKIR